MDDVSRKLKERRTEQATFDKTKVLDNHQRHLPPTCQRQDYTQEPSPHPPLLLQGGQTRRLEEAHKIASRASCLQRTRKSMKTPHSRNSPGHIRVGGNKRCLEGALWICLENAAAKLQLLPVGVKNPELGAVPLW